MLGFFRKEACTDFLGERVKAMHQSGQMAPTDPRKSWKPSMHSATAQAVLRSQVRWHDKSNISKVWLAPNGPRVVWEPSMDSVAEQAVVRSQVHIVDVAVPCPCGMYTRSIGAGLGKPVFHLKGSAMPASFKLTTHHLSLGFAMDFVGASGLGQFPQK